MTALDLSVFGIYLVGLLAMACVFVRLRTTREMFAAGGQSPWWLSGLSAFMTTFSAGTFVVWGGIAYRDGLVGVSLIAVLGISALMVGWLLAKRWKRFGYYSAAEFLHDRFGRSIVQFYTWLQGTLSMITMGGAVYALSVIVTALVPLPEGHLLVDDATGHLSVTVVSLVLCVVIIAITFSGGLWAVLVTDALQFIILTVSVLIVVPLIIHRVGGAEEFVTSAPDNFFSPVAGEFTWFFLVGWCLIFFFKMGGEWAYVQRFACVPSARDARKSSILFGLLYLVSPLIWMLPPMAYRLIDPNADHEQAYILACQLVLPAGVLGLTIAAMCSATASMVTTQLNVFAGAFTTELYRGAIRPSAGQRELVLAGRIITLLLGGLVIAGALLIPRLGTYTGFILSSMALLTGPFVLPTIWGLFSRKIGLGAAWSVTLLGTVVSMGVKIGATEGGFFERLGLLGPITELLQRNPRSTDIVVGIGFPLVLLLVAEFLYRKESPGWARVRRHREEYRQEAAVPSSPLPARLCALSTGLVALLLAILGVISAEDRLIIGLFSAVLFLISAAIFYFAHRLRPRSDDANRSGDAQTTKPETEQPSR